MTNPLPIELEAMVEQVAEALKALPCRDSQRGELDELRRREAARAALSPVEALLTAERERTVENAWRDGWKCCRDSLTEDEAFCLTEDVEQDAWLDSDTARSLK